MLEDAQKLVWGFFGTYVVKVAVPVEDPEVMVVELTTVELLGGVVELEGTTVELDVEVIVVLTVLVRVALEEDPVDVEPEEVEPEEVDELAELETEEEVPVDDDDEPVELLVGLAVDEAVADVELDGLGIGTQFAEGGSVAWLPFGP